MARRTRRLIQWFLAGIAALVLLALGVLVALWYFLDPDDYRDRIAATASVAIGRPVQLTGRLHWVLGRQIGIVSEGGSVANANGFGTVPLAQWRRIRFGVAARPLFDRQVVIDRIEIEGLDLQLQRNASGEVNWQLSPQQDTSPAAEPTALRAGEIVLRDASVHYEDVGADMHLQIQALSLNAELPADLWAETLEIPAIAVAGQVAAGEFAGTVSVRTGAQPDITAQFRLQVPSLRNLLAMVGTNMPAMRDPNTLGAMEMVAKLHYQNGAVELGDLTMKLDDTRLTGWMNLTRLEPLTLRFDLAADQIDLDRYREPAANASPVTLPLADLKSLDAKGVLRIRAARVAGAAAEEVRLDVE